MADIVQATPLGPMQMTDRIMVSRYIGGVWSLQYMGVPDFIATCRYWGLSADGSIGETPAFFAATGTQLIYFNPSIAIAPIDQQIPFNVFMNDYNFAVSATADPDKVSPVWAIIQQANPGTFFVVDKLNRLFINPNATLPIEDPGVFNQMWLNNGNLAVSSAASTTASAAYNNISWTASDMILVGSDGNAYLSPSFQYPASMTQTYQYQVFLNDGLLSCNNATNTIMLSMIQHLQNSVAQLSQLVSQMATKEQ